MPSIETPYEFKGSIQEVFNGIANYKEYVNYIEGVSTIHLLPPKEPQSTAQVRYDINLIKKFYYVLNMFEEKYCKISWTMTDSNLMKKNNGCWIFSEKGKNKTHAVYRLDVEFSGFIPSSLTAKLAEASLPRMFLGMQTLIDRTRQSS
jgi:ribosome-associated toxin RatA of RatAB toxin-antitoxin module